MSSYCVTDAAGNVLRWGDCPTAEGVLQQSLPGEVAWAMAYQPGCRVIDGAWVPFEPPAQDAAAFAAIDARSRCAAEIVAGFYCDALGEVMHYPADERTQANMMAGQALGSGGDLWCRDAAGSWVLRLHTAGQWATVCAAFFAHVSSCQRRYAEALDSL